MIEIIKNNIVISIVNNEIHVHRINFKVSSILPFYYTFLFTFNKKKKENEIEEDKGSPGETSIFNGDSFSISYWFDHRVSANGGKYPSRGRKSSRFGS